MDRALLCGICKYPIGELNACVNDVEDMAGLLREKYAFRAADIVLLEDAQATRAAIWEQLGWLVKGAQAGDRLVFYFSGHGVALPSSSSDPSWQRDKLDEAICPVDFDWDEPRSAIRDHQFHARFSAVPPGTHFVWVSDSCHSGDLADEPLPTLPHKTLPVPERLRQVLIEAGETPGHGHYARRLNVAYVGACGSNRLADDSSDKVHPKSLLSKYLQEELRAEPARPLIDTVIRVRARCRQAHRQQRPMLEGSPALVREPFLGGARP
jgi:hypothetical protein